MQSPTKPLIWDRSRPLPLPLAENFYKYTLCTHKQQQKLQPRCQNYIRPYIKFVYVHIRLRIEKKIPSPTKTKYHSKTIGEYFTGFRLFQGRGKEGGGVKSS